MPNAGADKISVNTAAVKNPQLIAEVQSCLAASASFLAVDAKRCGTINGKFMIHGGRTPTGIEVLDWVKRRQNLAPARFY